MMATEPNTDGPASGVGRPTTVRVRIYVVTDEQGRHGVCGGSGLSDEQKRDNATDCFEPVGRERGQWVEADALLPEPEAVVKGTVADATEGR